MSAAPDFSIVIPSFNQGQWLEACLKSALEQEGVTVEVIVMDGGSSDASVELIRCYEGRLAYWHSGPDGGQAQAIRNGFERARGGILAWLNSDDIYLPGALAAVKAYFEAHPQEEALNGGGYFIDSEGKPFRWRRFNQNFSSGVEASHARFRYFHPQQGIWQSATFWRREAYLAVGGLDPQFHYVLDLDLMTRLSRRRPLARLPRMLACFRIHAGNKTHARRDLYHRELKVWAAKHGMDRENGFYKTLMYARFFVPFVFLKIRALWRERHGVPTT